MPFDCPHVAEIRPVPDGGTVCPSCVETDGTWVNLRQLQFREQDGRYVGVDSFFEGGLWFAGQLPPGVTVAEIAPDALAEGGFPLGTWVTTYQERGREGALEDDERAALEAIPGWSW